MALNKPSREAGQAMLIVLVIGTLIAIALVSYRSSVSMKKKMAQTQKARDIARDLSNEAVTITHELMKTNVIHGYISVYGPLYYEDIPESFNPSKRLGWTMTDGYVATAKNPDGTQKLPVANAVIDVCRSSFLSKALATSSFKANPVLPNCPTVPVSVNFADGKQGAYLQLNMGVTP